MTKDDRPPSDLATVDRQQVLAHARSSARSIDVDVKHRDVVVRRSSIWQDPDADQAVMPTFPSLLRGSGSTGMPLKLYLLLLWLAGSKGGVESRPGRDAHVDRLRGEHTTWLYPERCVQLADLMLIPGFENRASNSGARRLTSTLRSLRDDHLIELHEDARSIRLLSENRDGGAYTNPYAAWTESLDERDLYVKLPAEFFTCGWFTALSPQAILALLVHLWHWREDSPRSQSFNGEVLSKYAPVSKSTMTRGERLLTHWSVLTMMDQRSSGPKHRSRHVYRLQLDRLKRDSPNEIPPTFR